MLICGILHQAHCEMRFLSIRPQSQDTSFRLSWGGIKSKNIEIIERIGNQMWKIKSVNSNRIYFLATYNILLYNTNLYITISVFLFAYTNFYFFMIFSYFYIYLVFKLHSIQFYINYFMYIQYSTEIRSEYPCICGSIHWILLSVNWLRSQIFIFQIINCSCSFWDMTHLNLNKIKAFSLKALKNNCWFHEWARKMHHISS